MPWFKTKTDSRVVFIPPSDEAAASLNPMLDAVTNPDDMPITGGGGGSMANYYTKAEIDEMLYQLREELLNAQPVLTELDARAENAITEDIQRTDSGGDSSDNMTIQSRENRISYNSGQEALIWQLM